MFPLNPFAPGAGSPPPEMAGRDSELRHVLGVVCNRLCASPPSPLHRPIAIWGPRGNGKTTLVDRIIDAATPAGCAEEDAPIRFLHVDASGCRTASDLRVLLIPGGQELALIREGGSAGGGASLPGKLLHGEGEAHEEVEHLVHPLHLWQLLRRLARDKPVLVVVDEAHLLTKEVGAALLQMDQMARRRKAPVGLLMAGTPGLPHVLNQCRASFWSRLGDDAVALGLLSMEEAKDAIFTPLAQIGIPSPDAGVQDALAEASAGYPYFTQEMGSALWETARRRVDAGSAPDIDVPALRDTLVLFEKNKQAYYSLRYDDLTESGILQVAYALSEHLRGCGSIDAADVWACLEAVAPRLGIDALNEAAIDKALLGMAQRIEASGLFWRPDPASDAWAQGIPSFSEYVRNAFSKKRPHAAQAIQAALAPLAPPAGKAPSK